MRTIIAFASLASALAAVPAAAQDATEDSVLDGDHVTIGVGGIYAPSYRGSDDYRIAPVPVVQGKVWGVDINPRAGGVALDFIPDNKDSGIGFSLGPVVTYSGNRARGIKDPVVKAAGKLDDAVEVGVSAGVTAYKLLSAYDQLTLSADVKWDVAGAYKGMVWNPSLSYLTPLSKGSFVAINISARHVDSDFADYYYSVTPTQSLATGGILPVYNAKKGWDSANVGLLAGLDLDGNLLNGGLSVFAAGLYGRMLNDGKDTPFTSIRGDRDQWTAGLGVGYTF